MPSVFPGIDPFVEAQCWSDFHHNLAMEIQSVLNSALRPRYVARIEERVYLERFGEEPPEPIIPDVYISKTTKKRPVQSAAPSAVAEPEMLTLPMPLQQHEVYLEVRSLPAMEVVTVIEVLSRSNKRKGSDGRAEYLTKRNDIIASRANLVELDLLREGERLPTIETLPIGDYYAFVSVATSRPRVAVYHWRLQDLLPTIELPLKSPDSPFALNLQSVISAIYDRAGYDYSLDYLRPPSDAWPADQKSWIMGRLQR